MIANVKASGGAIMTLGEFLQEYNHVTTKSRWDNEKQKTENSKRLMSFAYYRFVCGGSWANNDKARCPAGRARFNPVVSSVNYGLSFRCVQSP